MQALSRAPSTGIVAGIALLALWGCAVPSEPTPTRPAATPTAPALVATSRPTVAASAAAEQLSWREIGTIPADPDPTAIVASEIGYLVVGTGRDVWFSTDGQSWTASVLPFEVRKLSDGMSDAWATAAAGSAAGFIVVGQSLHEPCGGAYFTAGPPTCAMGPISWFSADGETWTSSAGTKMPLAHRPDPDWREFATVWAVGDGWDASVESDAGPDALLHSVDGVRWTALVNPPAPKGGAAPSLLGGIGVPGGRRIVWRLWATPETWSTTLVTSMDGHAWTRLRGFDGAMAVVRNALPGLTESGGPWLFVGEAGGPVLWTTVDLETWRLTRMSERGDAMTSYQQQLVRQADGWVLVIEFLSADETLIDRTWTSTDGLTWHQESDNDAGSGTPLLLASGPVGVVGIRRGDGQNLSALALR